MKIYSQWIRNSSPVNRLADFKQAPQSTPDRSRRAVITSGIALLLPVAYSSTAAATGQKNEGIIVQPATQGEMAFIQRAFEMRRKAIDAGDQAYGAVIVRDKTIVGQSWSRVVLDNDPTGHAEMSAIRDAARRLNSRDLTGTVMFSSSRPCPMCEAAAYWAGVVRLVYGRGATNGGAPKLLRC